MPKTTNAKHIGLGQAGRICNMPADERTAFIAEGLPIIVASARSLMGASLALKEFPREAEILRGHASEECAKVLILVDIIRCPPKLVASRLGPMMKWFYDHLARLIYADAQSWNAYSLKELQGYVDYERRSHYLEGDYSEFIMPNNLLYGRESSLYADVVGNEDASLHWHVPSAVPDWIGFGPDLPKAYCIVDALDAYGALTPRGSQVVHSVWSPVEFGGDQDWPDLWDLRVATANRLQEAALIRERATDEHSWVLIRGWQAPMYHVDFTAIPADLTDLLRARDRDMP